MVQNKAKNKSYNYKQLFNDIIYIGKGKHVRKYYHFKEAIKLFDGNNRKKEKIDKKNQVQNDKFSVFVHKNIEISQNNLFILMGKSFHLNTETTFPFFSN